MTRLSETLGSCRILIPLTSNSHLHPLHSELETTDNGYLVYDIEIAGKDGKGHEVTVDAGNGKVLHQDLEEEADEPDGHGDTEAADDGSGDTEDAD